MATVALAIVPTSMRMRGMGPGLVGIVDDEYSDLFFNPAYINKIEGVRLYTNLSNLHNLGNDLILDPNYAPALYYNLIGGIASCCGMKYGALLETGGQDATMTEHEYSTEIVGNETFVDTTKSENVNKDLSTAFDLFAGKKIGTYYAGLMIGPECIDQAEIDKTTTIDYYYRNDSVIEYNFDQSDASMTEKIWVVPVNVGIIMGEPENENSFAFSISGVKDDFLDNQISKSISQLISEREESFEKMESTLTLKGIVIGLNGRNKRRYEDHSISFLGSINYTHQPITASSLDTTYDLFTPSAGLKEEMSEVTKQELSGAVDYFAIGLGIGGEKYFDAMGTNNLFAIGFIPNFYTGTAKIKIKPETTNTTYYDNYYYFPDTLAYTSTYTNNETWDVKDCFSGFTVTIPAGLETHLTDRLVLRLGVTEDFMLKLKSSYEEVLTDAGSKYEYSGTDTSYTQQEPADELDSHTYKTEDKVTWANATTYHYGLGFMINKNIELDFLNFAQLTDLRTWVLGVNIKF
jgi:hypothetical protein